MEAICKNIMASGESLASERDIKSTNGGTFMNQPDYDQNFRERTATKISQTDRSSMRKSNEMLEPGLIPLQASREVITTETDN